MKSKNTMVYILGAIALIIGLCWLCVLSAGCTHEQTGPTTTFTGIAPRAYNDGYIVTGQVCEGDECREGFWVCIDIGMKVLCIESEEIIYSTPETLFQDLQGMVD